LSTAKYRNMMMQLSEVAFCIRPGLSL
jgi:hypothetical protein